ncbi:M28 family peptidase [Granulicella cerasi]|uniref:M28 family peptidase n=1 Tax=Granulicella cerasi TaxID=741063 RepID=A0ABW1ZD37_9BACT|nr:M28 family peptidase [Granulicella cerasi]
MKHVRFWAMGLAMTVGAAAFAQTPVPPKQKVGFDSITVDELKKDLYYVASDEMEGRLSLQPGDEKAIHWVEEQFRAAGLKPAATDAAGKPSYLQAVPLIEFAPDRASVRVSLQRGGKETAWALPKAGVGFKHAVDITAPVVFAGFGITAPEFGYDDYAGLDVKGKIVLIFDHEPQEDDAHSRFNGTGNTRYATSRVKVLNAQRHGALAVLIVAEPNRKHLTNAERYARIGGSAARVKPLPVQMIADDEVKIPLGMVLDDVAKTLFEGSGTTPGEAQTAIDRDLKPQSRALVDAVLTLHSKNLYEHEGTTYNVVALLPGSDAKLAQETVIISAHHDHDGISPCADEKHPPVQVPADPHPCPQIWHGADDNGSGTVGVVALARAFAANPAKPKRSILFSVFASEERGLLGAYWMAAHPLRPLAGTKAQINFDMIGRDETASPQTDGLIEIPKDTTNRLNLVGALYSPEYDREVKEANKSVGLVLDDRFDHESALNVLFRSDQFPFLLHDIPALWWFTGFHPDYHHTTDTADKIDYVKMRKILELAYLSTWKFGTEAKTPEFKATLMPVR